MIKNYYYYDQSQYYDHDGSYYNYGNYNQSQHRQAATRRKPRNQQQIDTNIADEHLIERKNEPIALEKIISNVLKCYVEYSNVESPYR